MKTNITNHILSLVVVIESIALITVVITVAFWLFVILWPWLLLLVIFILGLLWYGVLQADAYYKKISPERQKLLDQLDDEMDRNLYHKPELLQVAEMYRDDMQGSAAEDSLAYAVTVQAIDNYYQNKKSPQCAHLGFDFEKLGIKVKDETDLLKTFDKVLSSEEYTKKFWHSKKD